MTGPARLFLTLAIVYGIFGMLLGLAMAISDDHTQHVTHAHIMLAGWVTTALFAFFYHLFPALNARAIATAHFWLQTVSTVVMLGSLYMLYSGNIAFNPGAAIGAIGFALGFALFALIALPEIWKA